MFGARSPYIFTTGSSDMSQTPVTRVAAATPKRVARKIKGLSDRAIAWIFVGPTIFLLLTINIFPLIWTIFFQVLIGFTLAYLINKKFKGNDLWTTIIVLPMMLSPAVVGNFWKFLYQPQIGLFNYIVAFFSGKDPSSFEMLGSVQLAPWSIVIVDTWMWTPFVMLICLAGLRSIPHREFQDVRSGGATHRRWPRFYNRADLDQSKTRSI